MRRLLTLLICGFIVGLSGCAVQGPNPKASPVNLPREVSPSASPILAAETPTDVVRFQIDRPVKAGATAITGRGPAGVPISVVSVTTMGNEIGVGVIGADNRFSIQVAPLSPSVRIGISIGDLAGTNFKAEDFNADAYKGAEAMLLPMVGYFLDTTLVQP